MLPLLSLLELVLLPEQVVPASEEIEQQLSVLPHELQMSGSTPKPSAGYLVLKLKQSQVPIHYLLEETQ